MGRQRLAARLASNNGGGNGGGAGRGAGGRPLGAKARKRAARRYGARALGGKRNAYGRIDPDVLRDTVDGGPARLGHSSTKREAFSSDGMRVVVWSDCTQITFWKMKMTYFILIPFTVGY